MNIANNIRDKFFEKTKQNASLIALFAFVAVGIFGIWAYANSNVAYDETAPVTIKQEIEKADTQDTWFTVQFKDKENGKTYRQAIRIPATETSGTATVLLNVYREYEISISVSQSAWRYDNTSATYTNSQALGGNDEWSAADAGDSKTKLPATLKLGTVDKPVFDRTLNLKSKLSREQWFSDTASVVNKIKFPAQKTIEFKNQGHGNAVKNQYVVEGGKVTEPAAEEVGTSKGLKFEGWYTDEKCTAANKYNFSTAVSDVANKLTLYANWVPSTDAGGDAEVYWISPSSKTTTANVAASTAQANANYIKEEWNVKKSADEIRSDVDVLSDTKHEKYDWTTYQSVYDEYASFMEKDDYHLYTKIGDGTVADDYAEFRVINVGEHTANLNGDATALTFQAIHSLPSAYAMNAERTSAGGFGASSLATNMNSGDIFNMFNVGFTDDITEVSKNYMPNGNATSDATSGNFKFWLLSYSELITESTQYDNWLTKFNLLQEGDQYDYFKKLAITGAGGSSNPALLPLVQTRAGNVVGKVGTETVGYSYLRTAEPRTDSNVGGFLSIRSSDGYAINGYTYAETERAITPCFSFGNKVTINFDNKNHGNSVESQTIVRGSKVTEPTSDEVGTSTGLKFEGWYTDEKCSADNKWDFSTETTQGLTLYANWVPDTSTGGDADKYWISPSYKITTGNTADTTNKDNSNYVKEQWNVTKSSSEIQADVKVLKDTKHTVYTEEEFNKVKAQYEEFMTSDAYHLYTRYGTGDGTSKNDYVEFRILEVGEHGGGEALTFQATHALPAGTQMNTARSNDGGWATSSLLSALNETSGAFNSLLKDGFKNDVSAVSKKASEGSKSTTIKETASKFWVCSRVELTGTTTATYASEGTQYAYYNGKVTSETGSNPCLVRKTRSDENISPSSHSSSWLWTRSPLLSDTTRFVAFAGTGSLVETEYADYNEAVVPAFSFGGFSVTFDLGGHEVSGDTPATQVVGAGEKVTSPGNVTDKNSELTFGGWYKDTSFSTAWDFDTETITGDTTIYAYWKPDTTKYWIAPASKKTTGNTAATANVANTWNKTTNPNGYNSEEKNIKKSSKEIQADVKILNDVDHKTYTAEQYNKVFDEYEEFMTNDTYHLYTKWNGSTVDKSGAAQSANAYVEFRILEVGEHSNGGTDGSDGSVLTFQAIHTLAPGYVMRADGKNTGGWTGSSVYTAMQSGGDIYSNFNAGFTNDIMSVKKKTTNGGISTATSKSDNKFWMISQVEYNGTTTAGYASEGTKYSYYNICAFDESAASPFLERKTRAGNTNANAPYAYSYYWTRSPITTSDGGYYGINSDGDANHSYNTVNYYGTVPCFCFGVGYTVKYNGNGNSSGTMSNQTGRTLNDGTKLTANGFYKNGYGFKCWNTKEDGTGESFDDKSTANVAFDGSSEVTLYAQWVELGDYWIAPTWKKTTANTNAASNVVNDAYTNPETGVVKNRTQIQEDVKILNDVNHEKYTLEKYNEVKTQYQTWMNNDTYHLYCKYNGAAATSRGTNDYLECRILQVGEHDKDGSVLTFQLTHAMPNAYPWSTQTTSAGCSGETARWKTSYMRTLLSSGGAVYSQFPTGLTTDAMSVSKKTSVGGNSDTIETVQDKLWLASEVEMLNGTVWAASGEGVVYDYWKKIGLNATTTSGGNYAFQKIMCTRSGATVTGNPTGHSSVMGCYWLRSVNGKTAASSSSKNNGVSHLSNGGTVNCANNNAFYTVPIGPCFSFGVGYTIKYNGNGSTSGSMSNQTRTLNDGAKLTANAFSKTGYGFTTWNTKEDGTGKSYTDKEIANLASEGQTEITLYAQWKELKDYWIAPAYKKTTTNVAQAVNAAYTNPETGVVKNRDEIQEDMKVLSDTGHNTYTEEKYNEVKAVWDDYLATDSYHLYAKYSGATTSAVNDYLECRIIQVGEHDSDGTAVTFQAIHGLKTAYQMNTTTVSTNGWVGSNARSQLNGTVLNSDLTKIKSDAMLVTKKSGGYGITGTITSQDKVWLLALSEAYGTTNSVTATGEGTQYTYWKNVGLSNCSAYNYSIASLGFNRDGSSVANNGSAADWRHWLRSSNTTKSGDFEWVNQYGISGTTNEGNSTCYLPLVPSFAFGYNVVSFATNGGSEVDDQLLLSNQTVTKPANDPERDGYEFAGWYKDEACSDGQEFDFTKGITEDTTIYAKWTPVSESYWMTYADSETPEVNIVKTRTQIQEDVKVLKDTAHTTYSADTYTQVKSEYESFMNGTRGTTGSEIHLYTKVGAGTDVDDYAEFRLLQVGEHDSDGSVLTFQMTHVLPTAQAMNATKSNSGGWAASGLHTKMHGDAGEIFLGFKTKLTDDIFAPTKKSMNGDKSTATTDTTDKLWALSAVEVYGTTEAGYVAEGTQYDYYSSKGITKDDDTNDCLAYRTRTGGLPAGQDTDREAGEAYCSWWLRTPSLLNEQTWCRVYSDGRIDHNYANIVRGVAVAFCF